MAQQLVSVLVADDQPLTRLGIAQAIEEHGFAVVGETGDAEHAVLLARALTPRLCLIEVELPGGGIEAARVIGREVPGSTVVMLTDSRDGTDLFESVRAGATGYLLKDIDPRRLPRVLHAALEGEAALPRTLVAALMAEVRQRDLRREDPGWRGQLTAREWEILDRLSREESTAHIADELFVTSVTVRTHVSSIMRKLDVSDRAAAVLAFRAQR